ncbi:MAG: flavodoxin family protein [Firmicutes bacterium]|nr:flavodoxin family protein [Bacillota bacterium]
MKILVVYDSYFGNTERIALAIRDSISEENQVIIKNISDYEEKDLAGVELIVIGSPTRAFRPTEAISGFLKKIDVKKYKWIAFDTGINPNLIKSRVLKIMVRLFGYAAPNMAGKIKKAGGKMLSEPETFFVIGNEGPLGNGEIVRFQKWLKTVRI